MAEMNAAFFEEAKYNLQHGKINFLNVAGLIPEVTEERHVVVRLPANSMHLICRLPSRSSRSWTCRCWLPDAWTIRIWRRRRCETAAAT